ncbi:RHS repeat-associated core domain-containing protein [Pseudomonas salmasensis]|uniref:RHS repeat-associated core domain-containing protein n=1 Tax=Pseudomonas salmasensis TaxID=2745514 RepID=A0ABU5FAE1_9PSED|nr:RHS repeat-associated core domain-containing protein [Pseudomonas salmasensis]MDY4298829.1 RHS repeat-associated core domain-containing protein [Pseudomonas salmasensis]
MDIYSQAFNFASYFGGTVDPRTGQYSCRIQLATLYPEGPLDVSRTIALSFSMMNPETGVYGTGWRISNTEFDIARSRLTLLSGEQFKTQSLPAVGGTLVIKDRKLADLVVKRPDTNTVHVIYKDGTVEVLQRTNSLAPYRIVALQFENGERMKWEYAAGGSLERILDHDQQVLLLLTYSSGRLVRADTRVDGGRHARILFSQTNGRLTGFSAPYDSRELPPSTGYVLEYGRAFRNGMIAIHRARSPMGGDELINYTENGHQYANGQYIPRVTSWVQTPGAFQPGMSRTYSYSPGRNFTGFPFSGGFREGEDNLYLIGSDYDYWTEETRIDSAANNAVLSVTRTTYNKYHLLTQELVRREGTLASTQIEYNLRPGLFADQPANFQLPRRITKSYALVAGGTAQQEVVTIETDAFGNELSRSEATGVRTEYDYYPVSGEQGRCPADPHGLFQRFVKQERMIPAGGTPGVRVTDFTCTSLPAPAGGYFVLELSSIQAGRASVHKTYYDAPANLALHGRLRTDTSTLEGLALITELSYTQSGDTLSETRRLRGREGHWLDALNVVSLTNRRLLSMSGDGKATLATTYDVAGRLTTETASPGKPEEAERRFVYHYATPTKRAHLVTTDAQGRSTVTYYDGMGRQVARALLLEGGTNEQPLGTWRYDALGQTVERTRIDYLPDGERVLTTRYAYNPWGNASRVTRVDGSVTIDDYDPRLHVRVTGVEGGERLETHLNAHHQPFQVNRVDALGQLTEVESRTYDGLGRCLSRLDVDKHRTDYSYDLFDRVVTTVQTPSDGSPSRQRTVAYAPGSSEPHTSSISMDGRLVGSRTYDSLGRLTAQSRGTAPATTWDYETGWTEPVAVVSGAGKRQQWAYDKELGVLSTVKMAGHPDRLYRHDPVSAQPTYSENGALKHELFHDVNGYPEKEVQTVLGMPLTAHYGHSLGGRLLHHTSPEGLRSDFEYDANGRFRKMVAGEVAVEQHYDRFARPEVLTTRYASTEVVTRVGYDALGREAQRRFEQNGALLQVMSSTYHPNSLLASRFVRDAAAQLVIGETFTYDAFLRLTTYRCEGREYPQDSLGRNIAGQQFSFDSLDNITRVVTSFADGTQDISERFFTDADPTRLTRVTHSNPAQDDALAYDAAGNLTGGPAGRIYTYNGFDQLTHVQEGSLQCSYQYDAQSRQVVAARGNETPVVMAYAGDRLDTLVEGSRALRYFNAAGHVQARTGGVEGPQLHLNDGAGSVRGVVAPGQAMVQRHYAPYGEGNVVARDGNVRSMADLQLPAFTGERLDAAVGLYHFKFRTYEPCLKVFLSADPLAPFDEGGINSYAYCAGNPSNLIDPSGLLPKWLAWVLTGVALALSVVAFKVAVVGFAAALAKGAVKAANIFGVIATGSSSVSGVLGVTGLSVEAVDKQMGWDRSQHIKNLGWASFAFSTVGVAASVSLSATLGINAFRSAALKASEKTTGFLSSPLGSGLVAAGKNATGLSYSLAVPAKITTASQVFGGARSVLRWTNFSRGLDARLKSAQAQPVADDEQPQSQQQPQPQPMNLGLVDMSGSSFQFYGEFRREAMRIRQSVLSDLGLNG